MVANFNVYCALCSGCLVSFCDIGSSSPRHLTIRRARVARRTYSRRRGELYYETDDESEEEKVARLEALPWLREVAEADDNSINTDSIGEPEDDLGYDPELVTDPELMWLNEVFALGIAHREPGPRRYFISECFYYDRNVIYTNEQFDHFDRDEQSRYFAYGVSDLPDPPVFPMHQACLDILSRAIFGVVDVARIQKNILYDVMHELTDFCRLHLEYGDITGADQDWQCVPGEEYCVICPTDPLEMPEQLRSDNAFSVPKAQTALDLGGKVMKEPLNNLPVEMVHLILDYLPGESIFTLNKASWTIHTRTWNNHFWKRRLVQDMPWFWEVQAYIAGVHDGKQACDYRALFMWLDQETKPMYAISGPFMGVANRRRIWGPCSELAERYHGRLRAEADKGNIVEQ